MQGADHDGNGGDKGAAVWVPYMCAHPHLSCVPHPQNGASCAGLLAAAGSEPTSQPDKPLQPCRTMCRALGQLEKAVADLDAASQLEPGEKDVQKQLAKVRTSRAGRVCRNSWPQ